MKNILSAALVAKLPMEKFGDVDSLISHYPRRHLEKRELTRKFLSTFRLPESKKFVMTYLTSHGYPLSWSFQLLGQLTHFACIYEKGCG
jgi:hypothetical protein